VIFGRRSAVAVAVAAAALVAYHNALGAGFVLDDYHFILEHRELGIAAIPRLFWRAYASGGADFYRPLTTATFAIDRSIFGLWAPAYHAHNLAWHIAASLLVGALLARVPHIGGRAATLAALVFALHPIHTEAVTGVVGRSELMATTFVLAGCALQLDGRRAWAAVAYLLALLSKESGVMLPLLAILLDGQLRPWPAAWRRAWTFAPALAIYLLLRVHALAGATLPPTAEYFRVATPAEAFWTAVDVLGRDVRLLVWPHPLAADYSYPALPLSPGIGSARTLCTVAAIALVTTLAIVRRRKPPRLDLGLGWFALAILPVSNLVVHIGVLMAERLLYLPSVGLSLVAGVGWQWLSERVRPPLATGAALAALVSLASLTMVRNVDWQTPLALWRDSVAKQPRSALAHANLALSCLVVGDPSCARSELQTAVALDPLRADFAQALRALPP
jgi:hypothetical protein